MPGEWLEVTLGEVLTLQRGFDLPKEQRKPGPYPVIASTGIVGTHCRAMVKGPGVVIGRSGSIGGGQYVKSDFWPLNTTLWVKDFKGNDRRFCYYLLRSLDLTRFNAGSGVPTLNRNHIHPLPVRVPADISEQRAIAHILGTLDDKIELLRRMSETLEEMARAIFKAWFVDFVPVRAKMEGRWKRGQSLPGLPAHLYDLFPDRLVPSELGEIPEGWEIHQLGELMVLAYGKSLKVEDRRPGQIPVYGSNGQVGWHNKALTSGPGIVVGRKGNPGTVTWVHTDFFAIDTTFYVIPKPRCQSLFFLYYALHQHNLPMLASDSAVPGLNRNFVYSNLQLLPPSSLLDVFDRMVKPLFKQKHQHELEARTLAALRDVLLPKLIRGEIRVKDAERFLKERGL